MRLSYSLSAALLLGGCLPNLDGWRVPDPEGGVPVSDAFIPPVDDCSAPIPIGAGYREGFEEGAGGWAFAAENDTPPSWQWGTPAGENIVGAAEGNIAFMTRLEGAYHAREESFLVSPCFDASEATNDLLFSFQRAFDTEQCCDRASVELSIDGGEVWLPVDGQARLGWYSGAGFSGDSEWAAAATLLPGTAGQARVQLRIRFHSDASIQGDGFAIDDISLREAQTDLALTIADGARCGYANATVTNVGGLPITGFEIRTTVDGAIELFPYDRVIDYLQTQSLELGAPLALRTEASVFAIGDVGPDNDSAVLGHGTVPLGSGYFSDFEADDGGLIVGGENASWRWGIPEGELLNTAASGSRAWVTNLTGDYSHREASFIQTPCFDMSAQSRDPQISLMLVYRTEACCDGARVEVSVDGAPFRTVGNTSSGGTNWYDDTRYGWTGTSGMGEWRNAQHALTDTWGRGAVRVRVFFRSDGSAAFEGFGIDDLQIIP